VDAVCPPRAILAEACGGRCENRNIVSQKEGRPEAALLDLAVV